MASMIAVSQGALEPDPLRAVLLVRPLLEQAPMALGWVLAGMGWGWLVRRGLERGGHGRMGLTVQTAAGAAVLMLLDWGLGIAGLLGPWEAWGLSIVGWLMLGEQARASRERIESGQAHWPRLPWPGVAAVPGFGLLLGAACVAPGWLWHRPTEALGYDVMEYHLQLAKEWLAAGRITGLHHNVYSYLPNLFEASFVHLGAWRGGVLGAALACQMLSVAMAVIAAVAVARIVTHLSDRRAGAIAGGLYLVTPWTIATGAIAFDEQAMMALGAAALLVVMRSGPTTKPGEAAGLDGWRCGLVAGLLCGAATLVKLSAAGMVALPIGVVLLMRCFARSGGRTPQAASLNGRVGALVVFGVSTAAVVGLWMARNVGWCGQPAFPMFTDFFGTAHWTAEQAHRFHEAMRPDGGITKEFAELWSSSRGMWDPWFGFVVWPLAVIGAAVTLRNPKLRWVTVAMVVTIAVQVGFWVTMTHWQSRFLVPVLLPACVLIGLGVAEVSRRGAWASRVALGAAVAGVLWCTGVGFAAYFAQPGAPLLIDGVERMVSDVEPARTLNRLPPASRVYAEAWATPLYVQTPLVYHTVWDASPLGAAMAKGGATGALRWLRGEGFTHVVIDWSMLGLWTGPGNYGYDPRVSRSGLTDVAQAVLQPVAGWGGVMLLRVPWHGAADGGGVDPGGGSGGSGGR